MKSKQKAKEIFGIAVEILLVYLVTFTTHN